ncbi:S1/P1 nuclease [Catenaria anguillulae PL171]|uniref:S1/P1 nuclease n=1 Tax=Catenaria anguillulae PL171 TaxID=765915 RepID=A0A1Y2I1Z4_9FUNG|nr:S1/P1 nuclease [Catenaria anguillulae PL171]
MARSAPSLLLAVLAILALLSGVSAWGRTAHQAIATLAYNNLTPRARSSVDSIVSASSAFSTIEEASVFPDDIRSQRPQTGSQHFINYNGEDPTTGRCAETSKLPVACNDAKCAVTAIAAHARVLAQQRNNPARASESLAFLVHFASDISQPLHASYVYSPWLRKGWNGVQVTFNGRRTNLHSAFDSAIPEQTIRTQFGADKDSWLQHISELTTPSAALASCAASADPLNTAQVTRCAESWAKESVGLVCSTQIAKAALRVSALLNKILGGR